MATSIKGKSMMPGKPKKSKPRSRSKQLRSSPKKSLEEMDVDSFLNADFDSESESSSSKSTDNEPRKKKLKPSAKSEKSKDSATMASLSRSGSTGINGAPVKSKSKPNSMTESVKNKDLVKSRLNQNSQSSKADKHSMASTLHENDPEFYEFLKSQDKSLLDNLADLSDSEDEGSDKDVEAEKDALKSARNDLDIEKELLNMSSGDESDSEADNSTGFHQVPTKLEVASDDEEDEDNVFSNKGEGIRITQSMIEVWSQNLSSKPTLAVFRDVVSAFHAAVHEAGGLDEEEAPLKYKVEGGTIFNSIVRLCLIHVVPALQSMLQLSGSSDAKAHISTKSVRWKKLKIQVKSYISDLLQMLSQLSEEAMINAILKHVHKLIIYYANFPKLSKQLIKKMTKLWSTGEETTRVLAFLCINKMVQLKQDTLFESTLKQMYMAYVSNCKFTSPTTLPLINFMQKSLVELFVIDQALAYQYAFVYIRQLAIHLRNAISVKKKNTCQAVYNWQYIHCLSLWVQLLCTTHPSDTLQPLIYPLTQTIIGTIKLLPTARFYPLRFHCVGLLNRLSLKTNTFIPTVPFLLEVFEQTDFNKRHKTVSLKPFNFAVILKFSKAQLHEKAFKDGLIDQLYEYLLESYNNQAHSIGFPEFIIPSVIQLKDFLKKCKIANYCKQIKQIVDKIMEQSKVIVDLRKRSNISLVDFAAVNHWECQLEEKGTPLRKFYTSWRKLRDRELQHAISNKEVISGAAIDIPEVQRKPVKKATKQEREDFSKLFENESDSDDENRFLLKEERPKKRKRADSDSEDYSDFDKEELEQLAQSASSEDDSGDEGEDGGDDDDDGEDDDDDNDNNDESLKGKERVKVNDIALKVSKQEITRQGKSKKSDSNGVDDSEEDVVEDFVLSDSDSD
ncbi:nucleolar complex protein 2 homolog [Elysia marginata]|uniref:Nucleolar complex protein 2 homolog n=1 Tax=Elysia marginata TaxID=1093978 RepID=A0AAV4GK06_9GAST|nr:nucleolar complex protein 2 homolog [Elysia marginata]